jgi:hypothetical protein
MGRIRVRTGMAVAVAGLATSGFALLSGVPAQAAQVETTVDAAPSRDGVTTCSYKVIAHHGAHVRKEPKKDHNVITTLPHGTHIRATCAKSGWVKIVWPKTFKGHVIKDGWVDRHLLAPVHKPHGGVDAGGGGTSAEASPLLPATGVGLFALGSGVAFAAWRRRPAEAVQSA